MDKEVVYWDACCCLKWIKKEEGHERLRGILNKAKNGDIEIRTSAFSLYEVFYHRDEKGIDEEKSLKIPDFFTENYVVTIGLDIPIANLARKIFFDYNIERPDTIHIASAIFDKIKVFHTYNEHLLDQDRKIFDPLNPNDSPLRIIEPPFIVFQEPML